MLQNYLIICVETEIRTPQRIPRTPCPGIYSAAPATVVQLGVDHKRNEGWNSGSPRCVTSTVLRWVPWLWLWPPLIVSCPPEPRSSHNQEHSRSRRSRSTWKV